MIKFITTFVHFFLLLGFLSFDPLAATDPVFNPDNKIPTDPDVLIGKLDNGLTYFLRKNDRPANRANLRLVINAGSVLEKENQRGLAHFVEHMAFNGTRDFQKQELVDYLESIGMQFGPDLNAYTSFDETVYKLQVPTDDSQILKTAIQILVNWAGYITFSQEEIDKERGVIIEEWRKGRGAIARIRDKQFPILFNNSRYSDRLPIGQPKVINSFSRQTLLDFYNSWYRPDLMAVIAVGDFDIKWMETLVRERFSQLPISLNSSERPVFPVPDHAETLFSINTDEEATQTMISVYYKQDVQGEVYIKDYRRLLMESLYNSMFNERFGELIKVPDPPFIYAYSAKGRLVRSKETYLLAARVNEKEIERGLEALITEARKIDLYGFTESELARQKKEILRGIEQAYREREKIKSENFTSEYTRHFLAGEPIPGIEIEYQLYNDLIPTITLKEINRLASDWIQESNRVILLSAPEKVELEMPTSSDLLAIFDKVDQKELEPYKDNVALNDPLLTDSLVESRPIAREKYYKHIDVTEWHLDNGIKVVIKPTKFKNDELLFSSFSPGGYSLIPDEDFIAGLTASSVVSQGGVAAFSEIELDKKLAGKFVNVSPYIKSLTEGLSGGGSPEDIETMFQLIYLYFTCPRKDKNVFLSYQKRLESYIKNKSADPENAYSDTIQVTMAQYHPRKQPLTIKSIRKMNLEKSFQIYKDRFADASDFTFIFVGNIDLDVLRAHVKLYLGNLPVLYRKEKWRDVGIDPPKGILEKVIHKGKENKSIVTLIYTGPFNWTRTNRYNLQSMTQLLDIRLRKVIREELSGTYAVQVNNSVSHYPDQNYSISIRFSCNPDRVDELSTAVFNEINNLKQNVDISDINKVKETQLRQWQENLEENNFWLNSLRSYYFNQQDLNLLPKFEEMVGQLDIEDMKEAFRTFFNVNNYAKFILMPARP